jgi:hypothetical protein
MWQIRAAFRDAVLYVSSHHFQKHDPEGMLFWKLYEKIGIFGFIFFQSLSSKDCHISVPLFSRLFPHVEITVGENTDGIDDPVLILKSLERRHHLKVRSPVV